MDALGVGGDPNPRVPERSSPLSRIGDLAGEAAAEVAAAVAGGGARAPTFACCDLCGKWRRVAVAPPSSARWTCAMNADVQYNRCGARQELSNDEIDRLLGIEPQPSASSYSSGGGTTGGDDDTEAVHHNPLGVAEEAEGYRLYVSGVSATGYTGVKLEPSGGYTARGRTGGVRLHLGTFSTAVDAAVAYAKHCEATGKGSSPEARRALPTGGRPRHWDQGSAPAAPKAKKPAAVSAGGKSSSSDGAEVEKEEGLGGRAPPGLHLHLSAHNQTGYRGVYRMEARFQAQAKVGSGSTKLATLGTFDTAVEAAVAYARHTLKHPTCAQFGPSSHLGGTVEAAEVNGGGDDDEEVEDGEEEWEEVPEGILDAAPMREEGDEEARLRCGLVMEATGCLLRLRRECEYAPTQYHELIQALHLRAAGEIDDAAAVARARRTQQGRPAALRLIRRFSSPPRLAALVAASRALHGAAPLTTELIDKIQRCLHHSTEIRRAALGGPSEAAAGADAEADDDGDDGVPLKAEPAEARQILGPGSFVQNAREAREAEVEGGRLPAIWPLATPTDDGDTAAAAAAKEEEEDDEGERSGMQPPVSWGYKRPAEGGAAPPRVNLAAAPLSVHAEHTELLQDTTMYHLTAVAHAAGAGVTVHWSYPPGTPGTSGAWVTLCEAVRERWRHVACRVRYKLICRDHVAGSLSFTASDFRKVRRGRYVFAMHCEDDLLATSQVVVLGGGEPAVVEALRGESTVADGELLEHKPPPASEAAADLAAAAAAAAADGGRRAGGGGGGGGGDGGGGGGCGGGGGGGPRVLPGPARRRASARRLRARRPPPPRLHGD